MGLAHCPTQSTPQGTVKNWLTFRPDTAIDDWFDQKIVDFELEEG